MKALEQILGFIALAASVAGFIALAFVLSPKPDCTRERNTINYTWPRSCGEHRGEAR